MTPDICTYSEECPGKEEHCNKRHYFHGFTVANGYLSVVPGLIGYCL